jgi:sec-independent protein translocase protein TatA
LGLQNMGWSGLILILVALLLVFGPSKLPEIGKAFGKSLREFRSATRGMMEEVSSEASSTSSAETAKQDAMQSAAPVNSATRIEPIELGTEQKSEQS